MSEITCKKEYHNVMLRIGASMLMLVLFINILFAVLPIIETLLYMYFNDKPAYIISSLLESVFYLFSFLFPSAFFYMIGRRKNNRYPLTEIRLDAKFPLMLVGGVAVVFCASYLNFYIVDIINFYDVIEDLTVNDPIDQNYKLILSVISTAIVPAFCEEYLFRGVVLTNLLPYGRTSSILISSVLFGLMHQNPAQMLYATVAGIVLGLVYLRTRSIWGGVLIHFFNNLLSVIEQMIVDRKSEEVADMICSLIEFAVISIGVLCIIILLLSEKKRKRTYDGSGFGIVIPIHDNYIESRLDRKTVVKGFFSVTNTLFVIISVLEMALLILLSVFELPI